MPIYAYFCDRCNTKFEFFQHYTDDPITVCPDCETPTLRKLYEPTPVHYKGEGFYATDKPERQGCDARSESAPNSKTRTLGVFVHDI